MKPAPIVKIGIQYWMGRSLEATHYTDGKSNYFKKRFYNNSRLLHRQNLKMHLKTFTFTIQKLLFQASYHLKDGVFLPKPSGNY